MAAQDSRYFEFADGTPVCWAPGTGWAADAAAFSYAAAAASPKSAPAIRTSFARGISGALWSSAWQPWRSRTLASDGYLPATGLTLDRAYGDGLAALRLDSDNPIMFYGFDSGLPGFVRGQTYRLHVRWRTKDINAAVNPAQPYGVALKFTD